MIAKERVFYTQKVQSLQGTANTLGAITNYQVSQNMTLCTQVCNPKVSSGFDRH